MHSKRTADELRKFTSNYFPIRRQEAVVAAAFESQKTYSDIDLTNVHHQHISQSILNTFVLRSECNFLPLNIAECQVNIFYL